MGIAAFVVSILSWIACPVVLAVVALVLAAADRRASSDPRQGRGTAGAGLVTAARIIAWVNIAFYAGLLVLLVFILILATIAGAATS